MGEGYAIEPQNGEIYSPLDGKVVFISDSKHAIGIEDKNGVEVLIHMGIDTVEIKEPVFDIKVKENDQAGNMLANMDIEKLKNLAKQLPL